MKNVVLDIEGMKCDGCVNRIKKVLEQVKGIISFDVSLENKKVTLQVKKEDVVMDVIKKIEALDFKVISKN